MKLKFFQLLEKNNALVVNYIHPSFICFHYNRVTIVLCMLVCITCMFGSHAMSCLDCVLVSRDCPVWICFHIKQMTPFFLYSLSSVK